MPANQTNDTVNLVNQAAALSGELHALQEKCQHENTGLEISTIADELTRLSTTLSHLNDAINIDPAQYTDAFTEDLKEITTELTSLFNEIAECCIGLQSADSNVSSVAWFFKKGRVSRLLKHLEALKGTLIVMRTVLWHGKNYGTHTSERIAESSPHTMHEDRVILESVLASNREAILDLHNLTNTICGTQNESPRPMSSKAGDHHRHLSEATGVEVPSIPDVLPLTVAEREKQIEKDSPPPSLRRTFSRRGVRLGVHMSILDLSAHEAPSELKSKWISKAYSRQKHGRKESVNRGKLTALPELSRISEVDTAAGSSTSLNLTPTQSQIEPVIPFIPESPSDHTPVRTPDVLFNTPNEATTIGSNRPVVRITRASTVSTKLRRVMSRLSISNLKSPARGKSHARSNSETSNTTSAKGKEREDASPVGNRLRRSPSDQRRPSEQEADKENQPVRQSLLDVIKQKFEMSPITTPDIEKEFEFNRP